MIHYHGTPITPRSVLYELAGRNFCVSFAAPQNVETCHKIGQSVMLDNGAFSLWRSGTQRPHWGDYYQWVAPWLLYQSTWAVIPDVINGTEEENDALLDAWDNALGTEHWNVAPVWHLHEDIYRLKELCSRYSRVCFGSSGEFAVVGSDAWHRRTTEAFNELHKNWGRIPAWIHMLRGMSLSGSQYPFASVDSTDIARNHNRPQNSARKMADRWDAMQCPGIWSPQPEQQELSEVSA